MPLKTIFDTAQEGYSTWAFPAYGLIFVCLGALFVFAPGVMYKVMPFGVQGRARRVFGWFFFLFAVLWTITTFAATYTQYRTATNALRDGNCAVIEGAVSEFIPMPYTGHSEESFVVGGRRFSYSDYVVTSGFHNTASHGGPLRKGLYVRVTYLGNMILRLQVAQ